MRSRALTTSLALALFGAGCVTEGANTQVIVTVDAEPGVQSVASTLIVQVFGGRRDDLGGPASLVFEHTFAVREDPDWARRVALAPQSRDPARTYRVVASAYREASPGPDAIPLATVRAISGYAADQTLYLALLLQDSCIGILCTELETCRGGDCEDAEIPVEELPTSEDAGTAIDGSIPDGGTSCSAASCDDSFSCTDDFCQVDGTCGHTLHDERCDDGGNVCTDDACVGATGGADGCVHVPNAVDCDDGAFCNGFDTCAAGACTHAGDPCGALTCNETTDVCAGCTTTAMCPPTRDSAFGTCGGFSDACDESGTEVATRTSFTCSSGDCVPTEMPVTRACPVDTDGNSCGMTSTGAWSACEFADGCDTSGSQTRTRFEFTCRAGACGMDTIGESMDCPRSTDGLTCSDGDSCTGPDMCASGACRAGIPRCVEDGGSSGCTSSAQCDDGVSCTQESCTAGTCSNAPVDTLCTTPGMPCAVGHCDPVTGCSFDYTPCYDGGVGACAFDSDCPAGGGPPCSIPHCNLLAMPSFCEYVPGPCDGGAPDGGLDSGLPDSGAPDGGIRDSGLPAVSEGGTMSMRSDF